MGVKDGFALFTKLNHHDLTGGDDVSSTEGCSVEPTGLV